MVSWAALGVRSRETRMGKADPALSRGFSDDVFDRRFSDRFAYPEIPPLR
jgi:hypothetical protein